MLIIKILLLVLVTGLPASMSPLHSFNRSDHRNRLFLKWSIEKSSTLQINGQSNVNKFTCGIDGYTRRDTIFCSVPGNTGKQVTLRGSLEIAISQFDCRSRMITGNLRKTLQADKYPKLIIHFISLERMPVFNGNTDQVKGWVNIELAGTFKKVEMLYSFTSSASSTVHMNGGKIFCFSDFNLEPPQKLAGLIRIRDEFAVQFSLNIALLS